MEDKLKRLQSIESSQKRLERRLLKLRSLSNRFSWFRLFLFLGLTGLTLAGIYGDGLRGGLLVFIISAFIFGYVAYRHNRVENNISRFTFWLNLKGEQIARIKLEWDAIPAEFEGAPTRLEHPFETDLDLTGDRSIHRLLDTASSREGSLRLRDWLLTTRPDLSLIRRRQALVKELAPMSLFRGKLLLNSALSGGKNRQVWEGSRLLKWLKYESKAKPLGASLIILSVLAAANLLLFALSRLNLIPNYWLFTFAAYVIFYNLKAGDTGTLLSDAFTLNDSLGKLKKVLGYLETYPFKGHPRLKKLCRPFLNPASRPSVQLRQVSRLVVAVTLQKNGILWLILNALVPWRFYFAYRLNRTKSELSAILPQWLEVWFELEALCSLANFAYLNPEYTFPAVRDGETATTAANNTKEVGSLEDTGKNNASREVPVLNGSDLGHPLILAGAKVANSFRLDRIGDLVIITGSNMAGKSSFLRTLGVNLCLAYAGGPANAAKLETTLFRLFTCIKVSDSVTEGFSYFYAEVRRLKALLEAVEAPDAVPVFFLIDEIFRGTNNRERLIGSRSYVKALSGRNCCGAISTHDLELVKLTDQIPSIRNYHFREEVVDGKMVFDYRLRPGPSPTTNALEIMRLAGLPVGAQG